MADFFGVVVPLMMPGLVTIFLFQFVGIWNNFFLPNIMLGSSGFFPLTVGPNTMLSQDVVTTPSYALVITGALVAVIPLIVLFVVLQRYWKVDIVAGAVKS